MKQELTEKLLRKVLKINDIFEVSYSVEYKNIEITNKVTQITRFVSIHEFIHVHARDFLAGYSNGLEVFIKITRDKETPKIAMPHFIVTLTVPNLLDCDGTLYTESFSGESELKIFVDAVEWLITYRDNNPRLAKFWISNF